MQSVEIYKTLCRTYVVYAEYATGLSNLCKMLKVNQETTQFMQNMQNTLQRSDIRSKIMLHRCKTVRIFIRRIQNHNKYKEDR